MPQEFPTDEAHEIEAAKDVRPDQRVGDLGELGPQQYPNTGPATLTSLLVKNELEALLSSTTSGPRLAGVRQRQHSAMHIVDANLYKDHCGLKPRLILI